MSSQGHWNYRIIHDTVVDEWFVGEVFYDSECNIEGFSYGDPLTYWERQEDLISTYRLVGLAMDKPYLRLLEGGKLTEVLS